MTMTDAPTSSEPTVSREDCERVALAIEATMFAPHELPLDVNLHSKYLATANAAIISYLQLSDAGSSSTAERSPCKREDSGSTPEASTNALSSKPSVDVEKGWFKKMNELLKEMPVPQTYVPPIKNPSVDVDTLAEKTALKWQFGERKISYSDLDGCQKSYIDQLKILIRDALIEAQGGNP